MEVESQAIKIHEGTRLTDPWIHDLLQGRLEQMGCGVVGLSASTTGSVHLRCDRIAHGQLTAFNPSGMHEHIPTATHRLNRNDDIGTRQHPAVSHLAATFAIERR